MPRTGLPARQMLIIGMYVVLFAVQLHYKFVYLSVSATRSSAIVGNIDVDTGEQLHQSQEQQPDLTYKIKLNKRFYPSEFFTVSTVTTLYDKSFEIESQVTLHSSAILKLFSCRILSDRGPPVIA